MLTMLAGTVLRLLDEAITPLSRGFLSLHADLQPVVSFIRESVLLALMNLQYAIDVLRQVFKENSAEITVIIKSIGDAIAGAWSVIEPFLSALRLQFTSAFVQVGALIGDMVGFAIQSLYGLITFIGGAFTGDWQSIWFGIGAILKSEVNGAIGLLNLLLNGVTSGINAVISLINAVSFKIPDWVPGLGGETFGLNLRTLSAPQIPYLAQGAVLPANKPFMAVVGDQKHGTNIEAPLQTIKQALSEVMATQHTGDINIQFTGDLAQLGRVLRPVIEKENCRIGGSMVRKVGV